MPDLLTVAIQEDAARISGYIDEDIGKLTQPLIEPGVTEKAKTDAENMVVTQLLVNIKDNLKHLGYKVGD